MISDALGCLDLFSCVTDMLDWSSVDALGNTCHAFAQQAQAYMGYFTELRFPRAAGQPPTPLPCLIRLVAAAGHENRLRAVSVDELAFGLDQLGQLAAACAFPTQQRDIPLTIEDSLCLPPPALAARSPPARQAPSALAARSPLDRPLTDPCAPRARSNPRWLEMRAPAREADKDDDDVAETVAAGGSAAAKRAAKAAEAEAKKAEKKASKGKGRGKTKANLQVMPASDVLDFLSDELDSD